MDSSLVHEKMVPSPVLCRVYAGKHSCSELLSVMVMPGPEPCFASLLLYL